MKQYYYNKAGTDLKVTSMIYESDSTAVFEETLPPNSKKHSLPEQIPIKLHPLTEILNILLNDILKHITPARMILKHDLSTLLIISQTNITLTINENTITITPNISYIESIIKIEDYTEELLTTAINNAIEEDKKYAPFYDNY